MSSNTPDFKRVPGKCGSIPQDIVDEQMNWIKVRYRSEDPLEFWTHYNTAETFDEWAEEVVARLAKIDMLHQHDVQTRALKAGIIKERFDTINPEYAADYKYLAKSSDVSAIIDGNPAATFGTKTDAEVGFPPMLPNTYSTKSFISSIDRWPATLLSKRMVRMCYEYTGKPTMISGLCDLIEFKYTHKYHEKEEGYDGKGMIEGFMNSHPYYKPDFSAEELHEIMEKYKEFKLPDIKTASDDAFHFPAHFWNFDKLKQSPVYSEGLFRLGDDDDARPLRAKLKVYLQYVDTNRDDAPLYLFEEDMSVSDIHKKITKLYQVPSYFKQDLVTDVLSEHNRPYYRWLLIAGKRCGTRMHIDPRGTSAWNMSVTGRKYWVLLNPGVPSEIAKGHVVMTPEELESLEIRGNPHCAYWYMNILPRLRKWIQRREALREARLKGLPVDLTKEDIMADKYVEMQESMTADAQFGIVENPEEFIEKRVTEVAHKTKWNELEHGYGFVEMIQYPGEVILVNSNIWHAVINLDNTIAYTQNYTTQCNFPEVYRNMRRHTKRSTRRWLHKLKTLEPHYYNIAQNLDAIDNETISAWKGNDKTEETDLDTVTASESDPESDDYELLEDGEEEEEKKIEKQE